MRHGDAAPAAAGMQDSDRPLSPEGERTALEVLPGLRKLIGQIDFIITSPALRARRTALILAKEFKCTGFIEAQEALTGPGGEKKVTDSINKLIGKENIVVVGHMPYLSDLARYISGDPGNEEIDVKKAGVVKIHIPGFPGPGQGQIRWKMTPEELKKV
jgi:phosphohistidine phosphatase